jgi:hypothetical protein
MDELAVASICIYKDAGLNLRRVFVVKDTAPICIGGVFIAFRIRPKILPGRNFCGSQPLTFALAPLYAGIGLDNWIPAVFAYGGMLTMYLCMIFGKVVSGMQD